MLDAVMIRTYAHAEVEELARWATIPVINGLTDLLHPCQLLADLLTVHEAFGSTDGRIAAWIGDGNNMCNSWLEAAALLGFELRIACPEGYEPDHQIFDRAKAATTVLITEDPDEAVDGAHIINTDVWTSMGQETEDDQRRSAFQGYVVNDELLEGAAPDAIVLHCLPAHRGEEITDGVLEGPRSRVFDQAGNRLHAQKALMATLIR
jgi:ornithine carbamoyltransferase